MNWVNIKDKGGIFRFLLKSFVFLTILFILDYSIGNLLKYLYFKQGSGSLYAITYSIDSTKADFLVIGSSTAHHNYYPEAFQNRLGMSYYNTGNDGTSILYHYAVLKSILKRYSPKMLILEFDIGEFNSDQKSYDRLSALLPYYYNHPELRPIINLKSKFEKIKLLSKIYPFNSMVYSVFSRNTYFNQYNLKRKVNDDGYIPLHRVWSKPIQTDTSDLKFELDSNKVNFFKSFIRDCIDSNVNLYIVAAPLFIKNIEKDPSVEIVREITDSFNIPFYNYFSDTLFFNHHEYFDDPSHLNDRGAKVFSNKVIDKILQNEQKKYINKEYSLSTETIQK